jgi:hypothetical protein
LAAGRTITAIGLCRRKSRSAVQVTPTADISQIAIRKAAKFNANGVPYVKKSISLNAFLFRRLGDGTRSMLETICVGIGDAVSDRPSRSHFPSTICVFRVAKQCSFVYSHPAAEISIQQIINLFD